MVLDLEKKEEQFNQEIKSEKHFKQKNIIISKHELIEEDENLNKEKINKKKP